MKAGWGIATLLLVISCGGGGGGGNDTPSTQVPTSPPPPDPTPVVSMEEAHRFLRQASYGPTPASVDDVRFGGYEAWIDEQIATPRSIHLAEMFDLGTPEDVTEGQINRLDVWFRVAVRGDDQLRQRVAFALSQIMVVSDRSVLFDTPNGLAHYYDLLAEHSFGNFRDLMEAVTLNPSMGVYLSMLGNERPDPERNIRPDENYARELMQLFTIGLVELNLDGTPRTDEAGEPIPTYDQATIEGFAHVFTGWTFPATESWDAPSYRFIGEMTAFPAFHDEGSKQLLNDVVLPAGQTPEEDLSMALDNIFEHPNVAPFISRQLIQRLVSANPSPAYISRVAAVFNDDGAGERGNLAAVVGAILLDEEARAAPTETSGKLMEPLLRLTAMWRAFPARSGNDRLIFESPDFFLAQAPLRSPSVFNFYSPDYAPTGEIRDGGWVSPEMQITHESTVVSTGNLFGIMTFLQNSRTPDLEEDAIYIDINAEIALADDAESMVDAIALKLLGGSISEGLRADAVELASYHTEPQFRVTEAIYTIATSPEFSVLP
ncbi:MAG: DUF1800 domain-containing protein [Pseudomonadota bacterium]